MGNFLLTIDLLHLVKWLSIYFLLKDNLVPSELLSGLKGNLNLGNNYFMNQHWKLAIAYRSLIGCIKTINPSAQERFTQFRDQNFAFSLACGNTFFFTFFRTMMLKKCMRVTMYVLSFSQTSLLIFYNFFDSLDVLFIY